MTHERLIEDLRMYANDSGYSHADYADVLLECIVELEAKEVQNAEKIRLLMDEVRKYGSSKTNDEILAEIAATTDSIEPGKGD